MPNKNNLHHILSYFKVFFTKDILWKLLSLVGAVLTWIVVMNTINPTEVKNFNTVLTFENMDYLTDQGYIVSNLEDFKNYNVSIKVEATRPALDEISRERNRNNIRARVDLSKVEINPNEIMPKSLPVIITPVLPNSLYGYDYEISSYYPTMCEIEIDRAKTKTVPVELRSSGSSAVGYTEGRLEGNVSQVKITGPENRIAEVDRAVAVIDISGEKGSITKSCAIVPYDTEGNALEGFVLEPENVYVSTEIRRSATVGIQNPRTTGELSDYLEFRSVTCSPSEIKVTSRDENYPRYITLPPVDLTTVSGKTSYVVDITDELAEAGLEAVSNSQKSVTVTVDVGVKNAQKYNIQSSQISLRGLGQGLNVTLPESVAVEIGGRNVDVSSLAPFVDLTGLGEGQHRVPLMLSIPQNAMLKEQVEIDITISGTPVSEITTIAEQTTVPESESATVLTEESSDAGE